MNRDLESYQIFDKKAYKVEGGYSLFFKGVLYLFGKTKQELFKQYLSFRRASK